MKRKNKSGSNLYTNEQIGSIALRFSNLIRELKKRKDLRFIKKKARALLCYLLTVEYDAIDIADAFGMKPVKIEEKKVEVDPRYVCPIYGCPVTYLGMQPGWCKSANKTSGGPTRFCTHHGKNPCID